MAPSADRTYLQALGVEGIVYSRAINSVPAEPLRRYWTVAEDGMPSAFTHDGLSDAFLGKGSTAYYCHEGRWLRFTTD